MNDPYVKRSEFGRLVGISPSRVTTLCQEALEDAVVGKLIDLSHPAAQAYAEKKGKAQTPRIAAARLPKGAHPSEAEVTENPVELKMGPDNTPSDYGDPEADPYLEHSRSIFERYGYDRSVGVIKTEMHIGRQRAKRIRDQLAGGMRGPAPDMVPDPREHGAPARGKKAAIIRESMTRQPESGTLAHPVPANLVDYAELTIREVIETHGTEDKFKGFLDSLNKIEQMEERRLKNAERRGELIARDLVSVGFLDVYDGAHRQLMTDGARAMAADIHAKVKAGVPVQEIETYISDLIGTFLVPARDKAQRCLSGIVDARE